MFMTCFNCCWAVPKLSQGIFILSCCPTSEQAGDSQDCGRGQHWDSSPQMAKWARHTIWCHAQPVNWGKAAAWEQARHWGAGGEKLSFIHITCFSWVLFHSLFVTLHFFKIHDFNFTSIIALFLSQPAHLLTLTLLIVSPVPPGGTERRGLSCWLEFKHENNPHVILARFPMLWEGRE